MSHCSSSRGREHGPTTVTDEDIVKGIIAAMEAGVMPWRRPWSEPKAIVIGGHGYQASMWPSNLRAPKVPFGIYNGTVLLTRAAEHGYRTNLWIEAGILRSLGAKIVEGDDQPVSVAKYPDLSKPWHAVHRNESHHIFNIDQVRDCENVLGLSFRDQDIPPVKHKSSEKLLALLERDMGLKIVPENRAAYSPVFDVLMMPDIGQFHDMAHNMRGTDDGETHYWATLWHEVVHWTGHQDRLNRHNHRAQGDATYAFEELVAELGATFLCAYFGIDGELQHESYVASWCRMLKQDRGASLRKAALLATQAKDFILTEERPAGSGKRFLRL